MTSISTIVEYHARLTTYNVKRAAFHRAREQNDPRYADVIPELHAELRELHKFHRENNLTEFSPINTLEHYMVPYGR